MKNDSRAPDFQTALAFSESWNRVGEGSVYTRAQFLDWFEPIKPSDIEGRDVLELGFGNGSLLLHVGRCRPRSLTGVELGDTMDQTRRNLQELPRELVQLHRADLTEVDLGQFDLVYCIGVLHHLSNPAEGFRAVLRHVCPGGRFHCWVYAKEGNAVIRLLVEPLRRLGSRLPWWFTKYFLALPLSVPFFFYARGVGALRRIGLPVSALPLADYSGWIASRDFSFFRHVAFDQLVTPRTAYIERATIDSWLREETIDPSNTYLVFRNGNSWKFGGRVRTSQVGRT